MLYSVCYAASHKSRVVLTAGHGRSVVSVCLSVGLSVSYCCYQSPGSPKDKRLGTGKHHRPPQSCDTQAQGKSSEHTLLVE